MVYNILKDADLANDVFQETFIKVVDKLKTGKYNEQGKFMPWVMRIAHNLSIDFLRKRKKSMLKETCYGDFSIMDVIQEQSMNREEQLIDDQKKSEVNAILSTLPSDQREIVYMRHYRGLSFKEIAEEKEISINTALGRMRYALINLRKVAQQSSFEF